VISRQPADRQRPIFESAALLVSQTREKSSARLRHLGWLLTRLTRHRLHRVAVTTDRTFTRAIARAQVVTFDVFDTALLRCVPEPADVFEIVGYRLREAGRLTIDPVAYRRLRIRAETSARAHASAAGREDVTLREIHTELHAACPEADVEASIAAELAVETAVLVANPDVKEAFDALVGSGKTIAFVSDTYFSETFVRQRLEMLGFVGDFRVFASSDHGATKERGTLFEIVARALHVDRRQIAHLGDNRRADVVMATRSGVRGYWYRPSIPRLGAGHGDASLAERIVARIESLAGWSPSAGAEQRALATFGAGTMGPIFLGFTQWLAQSLAAEPTDLVLYCSRDGYPILRLMELFDRRAGFTRATYFGVSRRALNVPTITKLDARAFDILCANHAPLPLHEYFSRIGIDIRCYARTVRECGLAVDTTIYSAEDRTRLRELFTRLEDVIVCAVSAELPLLLDYCAQSGCFDAREITVVDIGWGASLQASLALLLASRGNTAPMRGFYVGTDERIERHAGSAGRISSWLSHGGKPARTHEIVSQGYWILEMAFSAGHGSVLGYRRDGDSVTPVLQEYDADAPSARAGQIFQDESYRFAERWKAMFDGIGPTISAAHAMRRFASVVDRPPIILAKFFGEIVHVGGLGNTREDQAIARPPTLGEIIRRPTALREEYAKSHWKRGYLTRAVGSQRTLQIALRLFNALRTLRRGVVLRASPLAEDG
jgi:FMN phosphatase YigB (HAD superfamily)